MARTNKKHDIRKTELLDLAQKLFYEKGYEKTTIEDILKASNISKGAFYHYFSSKEDLLNSLVDRMSHQIVIGITTIFENPSLTVFEKLRKATIVGLDIKVSNKELLKAYMKVIYSNQNLVLRHKLTTSTTNLVVPLYTSLFEQGIREGVFNTPSPEFTARMMISMGIGLQDIYTKLFIELDEKPENDLLINHYIKLYEDALERLLGASKGSLNLIKENDIRAFRKEN